MNKNTYISIAVFLVLGGIIFYLIWSNNRNSLKYRWNENYVYNNQQPYGTNLLYELLDIHNMDFPLYINENQPLNEFIRKRESDTSSTYFLIGQYTYFEGDDLLALRKFVDEGNTVFIALKYIPNDFLEKINRRCDANYYDYHYSSNKHIHTHLKQPNDLKSERYRFFYEYNGKKEGYYWDYFDTYLCDSVLDYQVLGTLQSGVPNFIRIPYGEGQILLHSNPIFFTNRHMIREEAAEYASKVFSHFPVGPIIWDKYSKLWTMTQSYGDNTDQTPLTYILSQESFKWAYYLVWMMVGLFMLFNLWRRQRPIPVKFKPENTSLEFMKTVGELYYSAKDNRKLGLQIMDHFKKWARNKYYINESEQDLFISKLSKKSEIEKDELQTLFTKLKYFENEAANISDEMLSDIYTRIERIKKNSK